MSAQRHRKGSTRGLGAGDDPSLAQGALRCARSTAPMKFCRASAASTGFRAILLPPHITMVAPGSFTSGASLPQSLTTLRHLLLERPTKARESCQALAEVGNRQARQHFRQPGLWRVACLLKLLCPNGSERQNTTQGRTLMPRGHHDACNSPLQGNLLAWMKRAFEMPASVAAAVNSVLMPGEVSTVITARQRRARCAPWGAVATSASASHDVMATRHRGTHARRHGHPRSILPTRVTGVRQPPPRPRPPRGSRHHQRWVSSHQR